MKAFLERIKLVQYLTAEIEIEKKEFVDRFRLHVDEGDTSFFSNLSDVFSSSRNEYKGEVKFDRFKIKRRKRIFETRMNSAVASGTLKQKENKLIIETEINGFHALMIPFYLMIIAFYLIFIGVFIFSESMHSTMGLIFVPLILIHATFMMGIPYLILRRSVNRMKYDLEREFYYIARKE